MKLGAVTWCNYHHEQNKALRAETDPRPDLEVKPHDLLFSRKNTKDLVAATAYVFETPPRRMLPDLIFRLKTRPEKVDPTFLWRMMINPSKRQEIQRLASGAAASMPNISKAKLMEVSIPLPPLDLQKRFRDETYRLHGILQDSQTSGRNIETLFQSLLQRAFDGRLTANWRETHAELKEGLQEIEHHSKA